VGATRLRPLKYRSNPANFGFRVLAERPGGGLKVTREINASVLPPVPKEYANGEGIAEESSLAEGVFDLGRLNGGHGILDRWIISDPVQIGGQKLWVQIAMVGDSAWLWRRVIETEFIDHVLVPTGVIVPLMTLAAFFSVRQTLRPLSRIASQAEALGRAVRAGRTLEPLATNGLRREIVDVVEAINAMLSSPGDNVAPIKSSSPPRGA
jgi:hypothetical protein